MKKILLVTIDGNASDRTTWSGIPFSMLNELKKYFYVETLTIGDNILFTLRRYAIKIIGRTYKKIYDTLYCKWSSNILQEKLELNNYDLVIAIGCSFIAYVKTEIPIIYFSDGVFSCMLNYYWFSNDRKFIKQANLIQKRGMDNAKKLVFTSNWTKNACIKDYEINEKKIDIVHFGANIENENYTRINHDGINLLFVGADLERKGIRTAIETTRILNQIDIKRKYILNVVGGGINFDYDKQYVKEHGFLNRNKIDEREKLIKLRQEADIFILPTRAECAGIVFCEAAAYGIPSIAYDTGGVSDYIVNGKNGYVLNLEAKPIDFAYKIKEILDSNELETMKKESRNMYLNEYNWYVFGLKFKEIIDGLIDK